MQRWEDCGTLGLDGCQGQLGFGMFQKKYVAYSCRTGNNAQSLSQPPHPPLPSPPSPHTHTLESISASQPLNKGPFITPFMPQPSLFCVPVHLPLVFLKQIPFLPLLVSCSGNLHSVVAVPPRSEPVAADCIPVCHLAAK